MAKRERTHVMTLRLSDEENRILEAKVKATNMPNKATAIRQLIVYGFLYEVDYKAQMENDYKQMKADRTRTYNSYKSADKECTELRRLRDDLLSYTGARQSPEKELEQKRTL